LWRLPNRNDIDPHRGADPADRFDVVIGSLPGYGFVGTTTDRPMTRWRMGRLFHRLLTEELGYRSYGIRASDIGAGVQLQMALDHPEAVIGLPLSGPGCRTSPRT